MMPITFFVFSWSVGTSFEASAADRTPIDPSIARAMAIRCSATRYLSARCDRSVFARSRTRKNSTINASRFSLRSRCPRSAVRRVRRRDRSWDRVGLYSARTILRAHLGRAAILRVVLLERLPIDLRQPRLVDRRQEKPSDLERLLDAPVLLGTLPDELLLEPVGELEHLPVPVGERFLPDDGHDAADVLSLRVRGIELVRDLLVVLARPVLPDPGVHEAGQGGERVDRRIDSFPVQLPVHRDLAFRDVPGQVRDGVGPVVIRDRHDRNLGDAARPSVNAPRPLVDRREVGVCVAGISPASRHFFACGADLAERLRIVRHVCQDDEDVHADLVREILGRCQRHPRRDESLDRGVVREVEEQGRPLQGAGAVEVVHEDAGVLVGDAHCRKDDAERVLAAEDLRLPRDLQSDLVVRQARAGEQRKLLTADQGVQPVDRRDAGLDELGGMFAGVRVDRGPLDLHALLREDRRTSIRRFARPCQDAAEHLPRHAQLDRLPQELHARCAVDSGGALEDLNDDDVRRRVEDLSPPAPAVRELDLDQLVVAHRLRLLDEDQRSRDLRDRAVLLGHQRASNFLKSSSIIVRLFSSSWSNFSSYFTRVRISRDLTAAMSFTGTSRASDFVPASAYFLIAAMSLNCRSGGQNVSTGWYAFCWRKISRIIRATSRVSCWSGGSASAPTSRTISSSSASSCKVRCAHCRSFGHSSLTRVRNQFSRAGPYRLYDVSQFIAGKCRRARSAVSRAQNTFTIRSVPCVTGSEKSPPLGETAPTTDTEPSRSFKVVTRPARS